MSGHREAARIRSVFYGKEDHGIKTCYVDLTGPDGDVWGQSFGGLCLDDVLGPDFMRDLCAIFDVCDPEALTGRECFALRAFQFGAIEGIEAPSGKRFTITSWRRKHWPDSPDPLQRKVRSAEDRIAYLREQLETEIARLPLAGEGYVDCEKP